MPVNKKQFDEVFNSSPEDLGGVDKPKEEGAEVETDSSTFLSSLGLLGSKSEGGDALTRTGELVLDLVNDNFSEVLDEWAGKKQNTPKNNKRILTKIVGGLTKGMDAGNTLKDFLKRMGMNEGLVKKATANKNSRGEMKKFVIQNWMIFCLSVGNLKGGALLSDVRTFKNGAKWSPTSMMKTMKVICNGKGTELNDLHNRIMKTYGQEGRELTFGNFNCFVENFMAVGDKLFENEGNADELVTREVRSLSIKGYDINTAKVLAKIGSISDRRIASDGSNLNKLGVSLQKILNSVFIAVKRKERDNSKSFKELLQNATSNTAKFGHYYPLYVMEELYLTSEWFGTEKGGNAIWTNTIEGEFVMRVFCAVVTKYKDWGVGHGEALQMADDTEAFLKSLGASSVFPENRDNLMENYCEEYEKAMKEAGGKEGGGSAKVV